MKFIDQLKAFGEQSAGVLDAKEQAMYLRLFLIANKLGWPVKFPVSIDQLKKELGIASSHTIINLKRSLEEHGFIETEKGNRTSAVWFRIVDLTDAGDAANAEPTSAKIARTSAKNALVEASASAKNALASAKNALDKCKKCTSLVQNLHTSIDSRQEDRNKTTAAVSREDVAEAVNLFSNNIHPITGEIELQKLTSFLDDYGKDWTLAAIREAAEHGGQSVSYIFAILKNWKRHGRKTQKGEHHGRSTSSRPRESAEDKRQREQAKWDSQESGWG